AEEGRGVELTFGRQDLGIGEPGGVIDGDMQEIPTMSLVGMQARPARQEAMTDAIDLPQLLDVEMDQFTRPRALVADHRRLGLEPGQAAQTQPAQHEPHRRAGQTKSVGNGHRRHPLPPQLGDLLDLRDRQLMRAAPWRRTAIHQLPVAGPITPQPPIAGPQRHAARRRSSGHRPPRLDPLHQKYSTRWRQARILVDVHSRDSAEGDRKSTRLNSSHVKISYAVFY